MTPALEVMSREEVATAGSALAAHTDRAPQLPAITGLRFIAALLVIAIHFGVPVVPHGPLRWIAQGGAVGVSLFFVLSGFILTYTYLPGAGLRGTVGAFYLARFARIYPIYLAGLVLGLGPWLWASVPGWMITWRLGLGASNVLLLQAWVPWWHHVWNGPGWSLSAEALFYAVFPLIGGWLVRQPSARLVRCATLSYGATLAIPAVAYIAHVPVQPSDLATEIALYTPLLRLPEFVLGMAVGRLFVLRRRQTGMAPRWCGRGTLLAAAAILLALMAEHALPIIVLYSGTVAPLFALLIYCLAWGGGRLARLLALGPVMLLGEASYSLYVIHYPVHDWLVHLVGTPRDGTAAARVFFALYLLLAILLSLVLYRFVEAPARRAIKGGWRRQGMR